MSGEPVGGAGRFAPSPTGPLHLGSLLAAAASYLDARSRGLSWQVRLDDLDTPRNEPGAERQILAALERHGLHWDGPVIRQSERIERYHEALAALAAQDRLFYCRCSRRTLRGHRIYPGTCRAQRAPRAGCSVRVRVDAAVVEFTDLLRGPQHQRLAQTCGDFVVRRRDGFVAYQLATAVDDGSDEITRVIRGRDLLDVTGPQVFLMRCLGLAVPDYGHLPLLLSDVGRKLSKQNLAAPLDLNAPGANLTRVLVALGLDPGEDAPGRDCAALLEEATHTFRLDGIPASDRRVGELSPPGDPASGYGSAS